MTFSLDPAWPTGYTPQTADPASPHYIGKPPALIIEPKPARIAKPVYARVTGFRFVVGSRAETVYGMLANGPMDASRLCSKLLTSKRELRASIHTAIDAGVIHRQPGKAARGGFDAVYSIGPVRPRE